MYASLTEPFIKSIPREQISWLDNVLTGKEELERRVVVHKENDLEEGFILGRDLKFNGGAEENLYLLVIPFRKDILSLRDLRGEHLPLLRAIVDVSERAVEEVFGVARTKVYLYVHYYPSYYHFHVHVCHYKVVQGGKHQLGKCVFLREIIQNLELDGDYYKKASMAVVLGSRDPIYKLLASKT